MTETPAPGSAVLGERAFRKPIYLLIDHQCMSSCESTTDAFEFHPFAKRIGEPTFGAIHFGNVGHLILPRSRILVQISTRYGEYFDRRFLEKKGITPHIALPAGRDALVFAFALSKK